MVTPVYDPFLGKLRVKETASPTGSISVITKTEDYTLLSTQVVENTLIILDGSSSSIELELPPPEDINFQIVVKAINITNTVKVSSTAGIDDGTEVQFLTKNQSISFFPSAEGYKAT